MNTRISKALAVLAAMVLGASAIPAVTSSVESTTGSVESTKVARLAEYTSGWVCDRADSICGLDDPKMLSKPAKVDYDALYKATSEYKKIRDEKIDPNSSEGIQLRQRAVDRIREKTESIRSQNGYCSVWKTIRHQDGRAVPDITDQVKALL